MDFKDRQREAMRLAAQIESEAAEANSEAKSAGGKEWEPEFLFFYRCHTSLFFRPGNVFSKAENDHSFFSN